MTATATAYPLAWPDGWPRTAGRAASPFKTGLDAAIKNVEKSLRLFAADMLAGKHYVCYSCR